MSQTPYLLPFFSDGGGATVPVEGSSQAILFSLLGSQVAQDGFTRTAFTLLPDRVSGGFLVSHNKTILGRLPRNLRDTYPQLDHIITRGGIPQVHATISLEQGSGRINGTLYFPAPVFVMPTNFPPKEEWAMIPEGTPRPVDISRGDAQRLVDLNIPSHWLATLGIVEDLVVAIIDNRVLGVLSPEDSADLREVVEHYEMLGLVPVARVFCYDQDGQRHVVLNALSTQEMSDADLEPLVSPLAAIDPYQPATGEFPVISGTPMQHAWAVTISGDQVVESIAPQPDKELRPITSPAMFALNPDGTKVLDVGRRPQATQAGAASAASGTGDAATTSASESTVSESTAPSVAAAAPTLGNLVSAPAEHMPDFAPPNPNQPEEPAQPARRSQPQSLAAIVIPAQQAMEEIAAPTPAAAATAQPAPTAQPPAPQNSPQPPVQTPARPQGQAQAPATPVAAAPPVQAVPTAQPPATQTPQRPPAARPAAQVAPVAPAAPIPAPSAPTRIRAAKAPTPIPAPEPPAAVPVASAAPEVTEAPVPEAQAVPGAPSAAPNANLNPVEVPREAPAEVEQVAQIVETDAPEVEQVPVGPDPAAFPETDLEAFTEVEEPAESYEAEPVMSAEEHDFQEDYPPLPYPHARLGDQFEEEEEYLDQSALEPLPAPEQFMPLPQEYSLNNTSEHYAISPQEPAEPLPEVQKVPVTGLFTTSPGAATSAESTGALPVVPDQAAPNYGSAHDPEGYEDDEYEDYLDDEQGIQWLPAFGVILGALAITVAALGYFKVTPDLSLDTAPAFLLMGGGMLIVLGSLWFMFRPKD